ncbi:MAG TPA: peptide-methionine (S)-S-oxide reductase MsrA [Chthonomonadaceae bacterium]|nr:peptide-methionine (S)-S-oxide reductase MsrA [Chthonomonadaceae bacterium]
MDTITLGGGCFWCVEAAFAELEGVTRVQSGYAGGSVPMPTYRQVCSGNTGHAEVVDVTFDPAVISLADILRVFFTVHDPTTLNRQGADVGTQYRSAIFTRSPEQEEAAKAAIREAAGHWDAPIVTEVAPLETFYPAEEYHQDYYRQNGDQPYCRAVIAPKIDKLRRQYRDRLKRPAEPGARAAK